MNKNHDKNGQFASGGGAAGGMSINPSTGPTPTQKVAAAEIMFGTGSPQHAKAIADAVKEIRKHHG